jgi:hypothetical protein
MFMCTPSEVEKLTVCSELARQVAECSGELFLPMDMPEPPKTSFLKGVSTLFSGGGPGGQQRDSIDLDTLCECEREVIAFEIRQCMINSRF